MTTCIVVLLCAGSTPIACNPNGNTAPKQTDDSTMTINDSEIAYISCNGVPNTNALANPAADSIALSDNAMYSSRTRYRPFVFAFNVPSANPRITRTLA